MSDDPERTTPLGLIRYSKDFRDASLAADDKLGTQKGYEIVAPIPVLYLVAHSIELSLKAYLLHKGIQLKELRKFKKYGHDLAKCLKKAKELGLTQLVEIEDIEEGALQTLNNLYCRKELNYIVTGFKQFPVFGPLEILSKKLLLEIGKEVGYPANRLA